MFLRTSQGLYTGLGPDDHRSDYTMKGHQGHLVLTALALSIAGHGQTAKQPIPADYPYWPAFISTMSDPPGHRDLVVFPLLGKAFKIPIRSAMATRFSPDGRALYGLCTPYRDQEKDGAPIRVAVCKIDLYEGSTTPVPGMVHDRVRPRTSPAPSS